MSKEKITSADIEDIIIDRMFYFYYNKIKKYIFLIIFFIIEFYLLGGAKWNKRKEPGLPMKKY